MTLTLHDPFTDSRHLLRARQVVRAVGPWTDDGTSPPLLSPSRGAHLVLPPLWEAGQEPSGMLLTHARDGRVFFIIPWQGQTLVGTTETPLEGSPDDLEATHEEVAYLLEEIRRLFPTRGLGPGDIIATFAGVRPLARAPGSGKGTGRISREHQLVPTAPNVITLVGGKYTNYRAVAEEVVEAVLGHGTASLSRRRSLPGGEAGRWEVARKEILGQHPDRDPQEVARLFHRHGTRLSGVLELAREHPELDRSLAPDQPELGAEVVYGALHEEVLYPEDFLVRRSLLRFRPGNGVEAYDRTEELLRACLPSGRLPPDLDEARSRYHEAIEREREILRALA